MLESLRARHWRTATSVTGQEIDRRIAELARRARKRALRLRPALPVPRPVDGTFAVRRIHRRARSQHADQFRLRQHHASRVAGGGLDPRRTLPPRDRHLGRRRHFRQPDRLVRRRLPGQRSRRHRRSRRRGRHSVRPPPSRHDHRHGRRALWWSRAPKPRASAASSPSAKC